MRTPFTTHARRTTHPRPAVDWSRAGRPVWRCKSRGGHVRVVAHTVWGLGALVGLVAVIFTDSGVVVLAIECTGVFPAYALVFLAGTASWPRCGCPACLRALIGGMPENAPEALEALEQAAVRNGLCSAASLHAARAPDQPRYLVTRNYGAMAWHYTMTKYQERLARLAQILSSDALVVSAPAAELLTELHTEVMAATETRVRGHGATAAVGAEPMPDVFLYRIVGPLSGPVAEAAAQFAAGMDLDDAVIVATAALG